MKEHRYGKMHGYQQVQIEATGEIEDAVKELESMPPPDVNDIYDHIFETPTWTIEEQKKRYMKHLRGEA